MQIVVNTLAGVAFAILALSAWSVAGYVLAGIVLVVVVWRTWGGLASTNVAQIAVAAGLLGHYRHVRPHATVALGLAGGFLVAMLVVIPALAARVSAAGIDADNLPGYRPDRHLSRRIVHLDVGVIGMITLTGVFTIGSWSPWPIVAVGALLSLFAGVLWRRAMLHVNGGARRGDAVGTALQRYDPAFALYFSAPDDTEYHVEMWAPYLDRIGKRWVIITREPRSFTVLSASMGPAVPVVYCPSAADLETAVTPGMHAVFYVNNGALNADMVSRQRLTHIQLLHGDSDKASSYNPVTVIFDRIFVAGQAGIDRYADNGVHIPRAQFDIVGRPQVESIDVADGPIREVTDKVVLYASTWIGAFNDTNYCSLPVGDIILTGLLARGVTVILRPHPYAERHLSTARRLRLLEGILAADRARTGRRHIFGAGATTDRSFVDCINAADALISDVSGVLSDALYSNKPLAVTNMTPTPAGDFEEAFPLAKTAYVINGDASNIDAVLDELLGDDPHRQDRRQARIHFLGDFDADNYADAFVSTARSFTEGPLTEVVAPPSGYPPQRPSSR